MLTQFHVPYKIAHVSKEKCHEKCQHFGFQNFQIQPHICENSVFSPDSSTGNWMDSWMVAQICRPVGGGCCFITCFDLLPFWCGLKYLHIFLIVSLDFYSISIFIFFLKNCMRQLSYTMTVRFHQGYVSITLWHLVPHCTSSSILYNTLSCTWYARWYDQGCSHGGRPRQ